MKVHHLLETNDFYHGHIGSEEDLVAKWYKQKRQLAKRFQFWQQKILFIGDKSPGQMLFGGGTTVGGIPSAVTAHPEQYTEFKVLKRLDAFQSETWSAFVPKANVAMCKAVEDAVTELYKVVEKWRHAENELERLDAIVRAKQFD